MDVPIHLPDDIARQLTERWRDLSRHALEAVALEAYRSGALSQAQVGQVLGLSFWETEEFLKEKRAYLRYEESDFAEDRAAIDRALSE